MAEQRFVSYLRVSTARQGQSGLGLEAQREAVAAFINGNGSRLVAEFVEIESGKNNERPQLARAINACKLHNATLLVAKLDRLARNVAFISNLMESGVDFVAVDLPLANRLTIHVLAAVAEHEREAISTRTKDALRAAKARGVRLGIKGRQNLSNVDAGRRRSIDVRTRQADERAKRIYAEIQDLRSQGLHSLRQLASGLAELDIPTSRGHSRWTPTQVRRVLLRAEQSAPRHPE